MRWSSVTVFALIFVCWPWSLGADDFYAVDSLNDVLVKVNTSRRTISEVGPLGVDTTASDGLVNLGDGELLAVLSIPRESLPNSPRLFRIDAATGEAEFVAVIMDRDGDPEENLAESLALHPASGEVFISLSSGIFSSSDLLGTVDTDTGAVTVRCSLGIDMDDILFSPEGRLFAHDNATPTTRLFYEIDLDGCTASLLGEHPVPNLAGMSFLNDGSIMAVNTPDGIARELVRLDPSTGALLEVLGNTTACHTIRDLAPVKELTCEEALAGCRSERDGALADLGSCQDDLARLEEELASAVARIAELEDRIEVLERDNAGLRTALEEIDAALQAVELDFQETFRQPGFELSGETVPERLQSLTDAILRLDRGRKTGLFLELGGDPRR